MISCWVKTWKVQPSPAKCVMSCFALDPKECHGKVKPRLNFFGQPLGFGETPTFLGLKLDGQLTFAAHISAQGEDGEATCLSVCDRREEPRLPP